MAAAKVVDMDTDVSQMTQSTYKIRELALLHSKPENGRSEINMLNAFSIPPLEKEDVDLFLINEIDLDHIAVKNAQFGDQKNNCLKKNYTYCRQEAKIIPEVASIIEFIIKDRFQMMMKVSNSLENKTAFVYKGCTGAGKSFAINNFSQKYFNGILIEKFVQSTDQIKNDIRFRMSSSFTAPHSHLLGFAVFKELSEVARIHSPKMSTIQEG